MRKAGGRGLLTGGGSMEMGLSPRQRGLEFGMFDGLRGGR